MSSFTLKIIALTTMIIDHFGSIIEKSYNTNSINIYTLLRSIGRIAFPIYAFLIVEGATKTRNIKKYCIRLFIFAIISEIPFDILFNNIDTIGVKISDLTVLSFKHQNVFFTLFLGVLSIYLYNNCIEKNLDKFTQIYLVGTVIYLGELLKTDYGWMGVAAIFFMYMLKDNRIHQIMILGLMLFVDYAGQFLIFNNMLLCGATVSLIIIYFYNGKKGYGLKWFFYLAYPVHLIILFFIWYFIINQGITN